MNKTLFVLITFFTLFLLILVRTFCLQYCMDIPWYQTILNDNLHHYQLGILLVVFSFLALRKRKILGDFFIAIGAGLVIDESMYVLVALGYPSFSHNQLNGIIFEFVVFFVYALVRLYKA